MDSYVVFFITSIVLSLGGCIGWHLRQIDERLDTEDVEHYKTELQRLVTEYESLQHTIHTMQDDYEKVEVERYRALSNLFTGVQIVTTVAATGLGYMLNDILTR